MELKKGNISRAHHYISQFYLAGFTDTCGKDGTLYVHDLKQLKSWKSNTRDVGQQKDYNRIELPDCPPDHLEQVLCEIEGPAATAIKLITERKSLPGKKDLKVLMRFVALMSMRVPSVREASVKSKEQLMRQVLGIYAELDDFTLQAKVDDFRKNDPNFPDVSIEDFRKFVQSNDYNIEFPTQWQAMDFVMSYLSNLETFTHALTNRKWNLLVAQPEAGDFICTDNPVALDWTTKVPLFYKSSPGFGMTGTVVNMPLTHKYSLIGSFEGTKVLNLQNLLAYKEMVATTNTILLKHSQRFIYTRGNDFLWKREDKNFGNVADLFEFINSKRKVG